jgi:hypothetical protein
VLPRSHKDVFDFVGTDVRQEDAATYRLQLVMRLKGLMLVTAAGEAGQGISANVVVFAGLDPAAVPPDDLFDLLVLCV